MIQKIQQICHQSIPAAAKMPNDTGPSDFQALEASLKEEFAKTNAKIDNYYAALDEKIATLRTDVGVHNERINQLEKYAAKDVHRIDSITYEIEILKQDRLRNNLRLTGLPPEAFENIPETAMHIVQTLELNLLPSDYIAYTDRFRSAIILSFGNYMHKRHFMNTMRKRNDLLVEEIFTVQSNAKIYCNDQLTPYFAEMFQTAWQAKKDKKLFAASSLGGRIKVRKTETSQFIIVQSKQHIMDIIENVDTSTPAAEMSPNKPHESPNSLPSNQTKQYNNVQQNKQPESVKNANTAHILPTSSRDHHSNFRRPSSTVSDSRNSNRSQQWNQMRNNHQQQDGQTRNSNRFKQQDRGRQIDLSPNQYRSNNYKPLHNSTQRNSNRKYNQRRFN